MLTRKSNFILLALILSATCARADGDVKIIQAGLPDLEGANQVAHANYLIWRAKNPYAAWQGDSMAATVSMMDPLVPAQIAVLSNYEIAVFTSEMDAEIAVACKVIAPVRFVVAGTGRSIALAGSAVADFVFVGLPAILGYKSDDFRERDHPYSDVTSSWDDLMKVRHNSWGETSFCANARATLQALLDESSRRQAAETAQSNPKVSLALGKKIPGRATAAATQQGPAAPPAR